MRRGEATYFGFSDSDTGVHSDVVTQGLMELGVEFYRL